MAAFMTLSPRWLNREQAEAVARDRRCIRTQIITDSDTVVPDLCFPKDLTRRIDQAHRVAYPLPDKPTGRLWFRLPKLL